MSSSHQPVPGPRPELSPPAPPPSVRATAAVPPVVGQGAAAGTPPVGDPAAVSTAVPVGGLAPAAAIVPQTAEPGSDATANRATGSEAAVAAPLSLAVPIPAALGGSAPPAPPAPEPPGSDPAGPRLRWRPRRHRRLHQLRVGHHTASISELEQLPITRTSIGMSLGNDGAPVAVRLFRPHPIHVVLFGGPATAEHVVGCALRFGAKVAVATAEPAGWTELGRRITGRTDRVAVVGLGAPGLAGSSDAPVLHVVPAGQPVPGELPAWTTRLWWRPAAGAAGQPAAHPTELAQASVVLCERLGPDEVAAVATQFRLPPATSQWLTALPARQVAVLTQGNVRSLWLPGAE